MTKEGQEVTNLGQEEIRKKMNFFTVISAKAGIQRIG